ncbi:ATP-binding protein [Sphingobium sp. B2D3C]|uniref:ATP-binding protein n=1 Tax=Sphingobium sp. B2D3C TaxID=2940581 RepID=UPI0022245EFD|nr:AAA family ATPase [Sphingobium sp. B2D3C]
MSRRVALLGLSGVGKTTLLNRLSDKLAFTHLEASRLIKAEQARRSVAAQSSEALRTGPVLDNQALLVAGFQHEARSIDGAIVFDGHSVIDGGNGLIEIPADVFAALELDAICILQAAPAEILLRRQGDSARLRPVRSEEALAEHQEKATKVARAIAEQLNVPFALLGNADETKLAALIRGTQQNRATG